MTAPHTDPDTASGDSAGWVTARTGPTGFRTEVTARGHVLVVDEPTSAGGGDDGATPYEYLLAAIGSCTGMTLRMYAARKGWPLEHVVVKLRNTPAHAADCEECETRDVGPRSYDRTIELVGPLSAEQRERLLAIADRCPVKQTLERGVQIRSVG